MARVHLWEGYRGEFAKISGGSEKLGILKAATYGLSKLASTSFNLLESSNSSYASALRIAIARAKPDSYKPRMCKENVKVTGWIQNRVFTANLNDRNAEYEKVVIKQLTISGEDVWKTRDILVHLDSSRIESLIGAFYESGPHLVMELTLGSWDNIRKPVSEKTNLRFGLQLLEALQWSHSHNIIHCSVQAKKCLIKSNGNLCLSDFKHAVILKKGYTAVKVEVLSGRTGYNDYESLVSKEVNKLSDIFAAACTIFAMDTGRDLSMYPEELYTPEDLDIRRDRCAFAGFSVGIMDGKPRQSYLQRISHSNFHYILRMMVVCREERGDATDVLTSSDTKFVMKTYRLKFDDLDVWVEDLESALTVDESVTEFTPFPDQNDIEKILGHVAISGIYFDAYAWSSLNDLVASETDLVGFFERNKEQEWLMQLVHPVLKVTNLKRSMQKSLGKRVPSRWIDLIASEAAKIILPS